jgi:hypothetical protein
MSPITFTQQGIITQCELAKILISRATTPLPAELGELDGLVLVGPRA